MSYFSIFLALNFDQCPDIAEWGLWEWKSWRPFSLCWNILCFFCWVRREIIPLSPENFPPGIRSFSGVDFSGVDCCPVESAPPDLKINYFKKYTCLNIDGRKKDSLTPRPSDWTQEFQFKQGGILQVPECHERQI